jgi:hypothetical protein
MPNENRYDDYLSRIPARSPQEILAVLAEAREQCPDALLIELGTSDGLVLSGQVIRIDESRDGPNVLLRHSDHRGLLESVSYLPLGRVTSVRVLDSRAAATWISFGEIATRPGEKGPTRLELRRELATAGERLQQECGVGLQFAIDWESLPESDAAHLNVRKLSELLLGAVRKQASDPAGKQACGKLGTARFSHAPGQGLKLRREGPELFVCIDFERAITASLARELESSLNHAL